MTQEPVGALEHHAPYSTLVSPGDAAVLSDISFQQHDKGPSEGRAGELVCSRAAART